MPIAITDDSLSPTDTHSSYQHSYYVRATYPLDVNESTRSVVHVAFEEYSQKSVVKQKI